MSCNNLRNVDINILMVLPKLSALYVHGKEPQCGCRLQEEWRWCQDRNISAIRKIAPECDTPSEVVGMWWKTVAYPGIFSGGGGGGQQIKLRTDDRERGSGGGSPLVRGSGGSCNLV
jgi:hypothetical protein